jgi:A/G-specific adenine glycosylase
MKQTPDPVAQKLVSWYRTEHRQLPWRETSEPYAIWLSEIMLQQTQVATVLPYYARFLTRFPTIEALAQAPIDDVLKSWEGLGYYARARNLHKAAQKMMTDHGGRFPETFEAVHDLPGIGQSTAGAILTFAFHNPHPILDGNVKRVLSRLYGVDKPVQDTAATTLLWEKSRNLLPAEAQDAYDFNQAVMELGATLCTPKKPSCPRCPWLEECVAKREGREHEIPIKVAAKATPHYTIGVGVIWHEGRVLIALRPAEGLLGGLWEFPGGKCNEKESLKDCVKREIAEEIGIEITVGHKIETVKHAYSHFKITLHAFECQYVSGTPEPRSSQAIKWVTLEEIDQYAFPKANKRVLEALHKHPGRQLTLC